MEGRAPANPKIVSKTGEVEKEPVRRTAASSTRWPRKLHEAVHKAIRSLSTRFIRGKKSRHLFCPSRTRFEACLAIASA